jgi:HlyD family secretion protein
VIHTSDWRGEKSKVGDTCWRDDKPLEIPDLSTMLGNGEVKEAEAGQVSVGQKVRLRLDAHPDHEYTGTVAKISRIVQQKSFWNPLRVVKLEVDLDDTDPERMRPSMRFNGGIETQRIPGALVIPLEAVQVTSSGPLVLAKTARGVRPIQVELGARSRSEVEVLMGLDAGDRILRTPPPGWSGP